MSATNVSDVALARMQLAIWELHHRVEDLSAVVAAHLAESTPDDQEAP